MLGDLKKEIGGSHQQDTQDGRVYDHEGSNAVGLYEKVISYEDSSD